ncbi:RagB/SusD family nutrient uptake outer membrane protein [uncultured Chryseobacterium sp.]|uniref:RagB/SusD family nutrient uptake outer membrane protein n=1 Tax=uncultured Chryseobacterium sp. TaxID=259322 RepID=UPI0025E85A54|nr:RagB/SusD family nutrient uptake outer membrane protein [uncultured Chryseobacterium sp.]
MKKIIKSTCILLLPLLAVSSCKDSFLDEDPPSAISAETMNNKLSLQAALIGLYQNLSNYYTQSDWQGWVSVWQVGTDIVWPQEIQGVEIPYYNYSLLTSTDGPAARLWAHNYNIIRNANAIIYNVENNTISDMTDAEKKAFSAEARFFRAYAYNSLATFYGGVPLITEPIKTPRYDFVRAPIDQVNTQIKNDLLYSVSNLPVVGQTAAEQRVNKDVARQLLAKVYLRTNEPALAEAQCDAIINSGKYSLVNARYGVKAGSPGDYFSDMFFKGNQRRSQGNKEAIWVLENENPSIIVNGSSGSPQQRRVWGGGYHNINGMIPADSLGGRGLSRIRLNNWVLYKLYPQGDMRNSKYSIHRQHYFNNTASKYNSIKGLPVPYGQDKQYTLSDGTTVNIAKSDTLAKINPYTLKWGQFDPNDVFGFGMWKDFILMRLGETYLLKAEAQVKQGNTSGAAASINVLRTRAQAPQVSASQMTLDFVLDERARELLAEENRREELVRTKTLLQRVAAHNTDGPSQRQIVGLTANNLLLPIPLNEIQLNSQAVLEQNPGY